MNKPPNILLFLTDDQRFDTIHALGNRQIHTPHLDALVARGTTFTRAHIPGGTCGAVCMPSRAMLHTGRTLFHLQGQGQSIPGAHITIGEHCRSHDYATFGTGKWHNGRAAFARGYADGDEIFFGGMGDHWNVPAYRFDPAGRYDRRLPFVPDPARSNKPAYRDADHINAGHHSTDLFVDAAIRFLERRDAARPFFMYVALMAPHDPRTMPERYLKMYAPDDIELPANFQPRHAIDTGALEIRDELLAASPRSPSEIKRHIAEYYAMITHLDDAFGRLHAALERRACLENTILVFTGDNGLALGQHGLMGKQNLYDHSVRVPLVFAGPGIPAGAKCGALAYLLDIFPTLCDLTGLDIPESVEGRSLAPCLGNRSAAARPELYLAYADGIRGITDGCYKLIEYACGATQLFDTRTDPLETRNIADRPGAAKILADLRRRLALLARDGDDRNHPTGRAFWDKRPELEQSMQSLPVKPPAAAG